MLAPLLALVVLAVSVSAGADKPCHAEGKSGDLTWKQTSQSDLSDKAGALGVSVKGNFPKQTTRGPVGMGCGIDWKDGAIHAGFDGGSAHEGAGGGFVWGKDRLVGITGVSYKDVKIDMNVTITDQKDVIFFVNGKEMDWNRVLEAQKP